MNRLEAFRQMGDHLIYKKVLKRLTRDDLAFCERFLGENSNLSKSEFSDAVRNLLVAPNKPSNVLLMDELFMAANTRSDK